MTMPSSSKKGLRGPRPQQLKVSRGSSPSKPSKKPHGGAAPVIVYEHTPRVVHARPQEFMTVVQQLTGKQPSPSPSSLFEEGGVDPLLLTLGHRRAAAPQLSTPSPISAGLLLSPSFLFSPSTVQAIQELSPLF